MSEIQAFTVSTGTFFSLSYAGVWLDEPVPRDVDPYVLAKKVEVLTEVYVRIKQGAADTWEIEFPSVSGDMAMLQGVTCFNASMCHDLANGSAIVITETRKGVRPTGTISISLPSLASSASFSPTSSAAEVASSLGLIVEGSVSVYRMGPSSTGKTEWVITYLQNMGQRPVPVASSVLLQNGAVTTARQPSAFGSGHAQRT